MQLSGNQQATQWAKRLLISLAVFYALLALFLALPASVTDLGVVQWAQQHKSNVLHWVSVALGELGKPYFVAIKALLPAVLLIFYNYRREGLFLMATLLADIANLILKNIFNRPRPTADVAQVLIEARNAGFPSGHTVNFIVYFGFLLVLLPMAKNINSFWRSVIAGLLLFLIFIGPFSRIYAGMHWPSDIVGGGFFGTIFLAMMCYAWFTNAQKHQSPDS